MKGSHVYNSRTLRGNEGRMIIELKPTGRFETFRGVQFRVYAGHTDQGVKLEMLGMFRIGDVAARDRFEREISEVPIERVAHLLTTEGLSKP